MLGKVPATDDPVSIRAVALINWDLTVARCAIFKSANYHRFDNSCVPPEAIFKASIKAHLKYQFSFYSSRNLTHLVTTEGALLMHLLRWRTSDLFSICKNM